MAADACGAGGTEHGSTRFTLHRGFEVEHMMQNRVENQESSKVAGLEMHSGMHDDKQLEPMDVKASGAEH